MPFFLTSVLMFADCGVTNNILSRQPRLLNGDSYDDLPVDYEERSDFFSSNRTNQGPRLINGQESKRGAWPWQVISSSKIIKLYTL